MAPPFTNAPYGMVPQNPTWLQTLPQQQSPLQFTPPSATLQIALQLAAQQLAQQLTGQQLHPAALQQALHQLAQFHYWVAQQLASWRPSRSLKACSAAPTRISSCLARSGPILAPGRCIDVGRWRDSTLSSARGVVNLKTKTEVGGHPNG